MKRLTCLLIIAAAACRNPAGPDVVAIVGDQVLRYQQFSDYVSAIVGGRSEALGSGVLAALFDEFLDQAVAAELAATEVPRGTAADRIFEVWVDGFDVADPSDAELRELFRRHQTSLSQRRAVLRQILVETRRSAEDVRRRIEAGASFAEVADSVDGEGGSGQAGGLQGTFTIGDLPHSVAGTIFALEPGEVSAVIELEHGFALFEVDRFIDAEAGGFAAMRAELRRQALAERRQQVLEDRVAAYRTPENVTIYPANLPFEYGGAYEDLADDDN